MVRNLPANGGDASDVGSIPGLGRSPGGRNGNPFRYSWPGKSHGQKSLTGYSLCGYKESDRTEQLSMNIHVNVTISQNTSFSDI